MGEFRIGMKVYDNDWYLKHDLSYDAAAALLADWGVSFVIAQSRLLPMPDSAVKSEVEPHLRARHAGYDDRKFRDALARRGILYVASCLMFFDPQALAADPGLAAIGSDGLPMPKIDWYVGIPPTRRRHVERKLDLIDRAVRALEPDGIHLGFMRWPGFWELWMPRHRRQDFPEYSYDPGSLDLFAAATGTVLPSREPKAVAAWIESNARDAWSGWKCTVVRDVIAEVRQRLRAVVPNGRVMLNTLPFGRADYDDAAAKVFGQRFEQLAEVVDVFEVMAYHQILDRPAAWIAEIGSEVKRRSNRTTVCTLQAVPLYLEGMHAAENRRREIGRAEFEGAIDGCIGAGVDGLVFFVWSDFLRQALVDKDDSRLRIIGSAARRLAG